MAEALDRAMRWLLDRQHEDGWWTDELESNVTMTAEHVLLLSFLGLPLDEVRDGARRHILGAQREDGSWALYYDGPADLSTTIEAYVALKVLGCSMQDPALQAALRVIHQQGGVARARVFTKMWLALFGAYPWAGVPSMPPELVFLPLSLPFNLYDFASWARGTIAPLLIVLTRRPVRSLGVDVSEIVLPGSEPALHRVPGAGPFWWLDRMLKWYDRLPVHPFRAEARRRIVDWIVNHQEADGGWGGIQPPWVYSLVALNLEGMGVTHPVMSAGLRGFDTFALQDDGGWRLQACMSPVWDTAWALQALRYAGLPRDHPAIRRAVLWLLQEEIRAGGDWQLKAPGVPGGGWAFEFENDTYPDIDDTAVVVVSLLFGQMRDEAAGAIGRAREWVLGMRSRNGAWGAFDKDNTRELVYRIPFADFGALLDPPTEDVTAHVVEMLVRLSCPLDDPVLCRAVEYLRATQQADGSWFGRWGVNYLYGTWCVLAALAAIPRPPDSVQEMMRRAARWVVSRQNPDGGWGETPYSYDDPSFSGAGISMPSQTAWAVMSLQLTGNGAHHACRRGIDYLLEHQTGTGTWEEPQFTGTGFPRDFYLNYHLYRHLFPTMALALAELDPEQVTPLGPPE